MKIRPEQMATFAADRLDQLVATAAVMVTTRYPEVALPRTPEELDALVRQYIDEAVRVGFRSERAALRYIEYRIEFRDGLWTAPEWAWARDIFLDPALDEAKKLARIDHLAYGAPPPDDLPS